MAEYARCALSGGAGPTDPARGPDLRTPPAGPTRGPGLRTRPAGTARRQQLTGWDQPATCFNQQTLIGFHRTLVKTTKFLAVFCRCANIPFG